MLNLLTTGTAVLIFFLATAFILRAPLADAARGYRENALAEAQQRKQQAEREALLHTLTAQLDATAETFQQLRDVASAFETTVGAILGLPLHTADLRSSTRLRHLTLTNDAFRITWSAVLNTYVSREELVAKDQVLSQIRTNLSAGQVRDEDQVQLDKLNQWVRERLDQFNAAESLPQQLRHLLNGPEPYATTAQSMERN